MLEQLVKDILCIGLWQSLEFALGGYRGKVNLKEMELVLEFIFLKGNNLGRCPLNVYGQNLSARGPSIVIRWRHRENLPEDFDIIHPGHAKMTLNDYKAGRRGPIPANFTP